MRKIIASFTYTVIAVLISRHLNKNGCTGSFSWILEQGWDIARGHVTFVEKVTGHAMAGLEVIAPIISPFWPMSFYIGLRLRRLLYTLVDQSIKQQRIPGYVKFLCRSRADKYMFLGVLGIILSLQKSFINHVGCEDTTIYKFGRVARHSFDSGLPPPEIQLSQEFRYHSYCSCIHKSSVLIHQPLHSRFFDAEVLAKARESIGTAARRSVVCIDLVN